ncbi:hypothetical protein Hanom_Chr16g01517091 [Helianthus anomalus]
MLHVFELKSILITKKDRYQMSFFFSKKDFKCQICIPATDKHMKSERKLNHAILEFVTLLSSCISRSL